MLFTMFLLADLKEKNTLYSGFKIHALKSVKQENWSLSVNSILINEGRKLNKNSSLRRLKVYAQKTRGKMPFKNSISTNVLSLSFLLHPLLPFLLLSMTGWFPGYIGVSVVRMLDEESVYVHIVASQLSLYVHRTHTQAIYNYAERGVFP
jgi:hypothetical protein